MARQKKSQAMADAKKFYKLLLYEATGGNLGTKPEVEIKNNTADFSEKKGLLSEIIKLATLEQKSIEDEEPVSGLDLLRKELANGSRESTGRRDFGGTDESASDDDASESAD